MRSRWSGVACGRCAGARAPSTWTSCAMAAAPCARRSSPFPIPSCPTATSGSARSRSSTRSPSPPPVADERQPVTVHRLLKMKETGARIVVLTCYDALFARLLDEGVVAREHDDPRTRFLHLQEPVDGDRLPLVSHGWWARGARRAPRSRGARSRGWAARDGEW